MSTVSRVSVPSEFFDITSQIMLRAPEPSYAYARLLMAASGRAEMLRVGESNAPPSRALPEQGAAVPDLMDMGLLIGDPIRAEAIVVSDELGRGPGHTVRFNRPRFAGGGYTLASRTIGSSVTISKTAIPITQDQVSITIQRFAGPFADGGTVVQPYGIDRFDATRSVHSLASLVGLHLTRDRMKWLDSVIGTLFDDGSTVIYPGDSINAITTDASAFVVQGDRPMDVETIFRAEQVLNDANVPSSPTGATSRSSPRRRPASSRATRPSSSSRPSIRPATPSPRPTSEPWVRSRSTSRRPTRPTPRRSRASASSTAVCSAPARSATRPRSSPPAWRQTRPTTTARRRSSFGSPTRASASSTRASCSTSTAPDRAQGATP